MSDQSSPKRRKISKDVILTDVLEHFLGAGGTALEPPVEMQSLLGNGIKVHQDLHKLQQLFEAANFRTSIVQSPRLAVSVYKDSCFVATNDEGSSINSNGNNTHDNAIKQQQQEYLLTMLGLHSDQDERETFYKDHFRERYCLQQFLARLRFACRNAMKDSRVQEWIDKHGKATSINTASVVQNLMKLILQADPKIRQEQLDHEMERIQWQNCTLTNALLQQFLREFHNCIIKDVFFKTAHFAKYERITFYLYDPDIDLVKPATNFIFLPDLSRALQQPQQELKAGQPHRERGTRGIVQDMLATFWSHLLRHGGYYASATMKEQLSPALEKYFLSGLRQDPTVPLKL